MTPVVTRLGVPISSVAALGDSLYIGGEDGSLRLALSSEPSSASAKFEVLETNPKFARDRKPVRALHAVPEWGLLLSLLGASRRRGVATSEPQRCATR